MQPASYTHHHSTLARFILFFAFLYAAFGQPGIAPQSEPAIHGGSGWELTREKPPRNSASQHVKDCVDYLAKRPCPRSAATARGRHEGLNESPFCVG